jgi:hypothetical protein
MPFREKDVAGFDVTVDDATFVRVLEPIGDFPGDSQRFVSRHTPVLIDAFTK